MVSREQRREKIVTFDAMIDADLAFEDLTSEEHALVQADIAALKEGGSVPHSEVRKKYVDSSSS